jgi:hypothetical protein
MSGYYVNRPESRVGPGNEDFAALAESYPAIAWLLAGRSKEHAAGEMSACSIILFFDSGKLKFCATPRHGVECAFGSVTNVGDVLGSIEAFIVEGKLEWKTKRR